MDLTPGAISRVEFPSARKGFDPAAVRTYLSQLAFTVGSLQQQLAEARDDAEAERARAGELERRADDIIAEAEAKAAELTEAAERDAAAAANERKDAEHEAARRLEAADQEAAARRLAAEEEAAQRLQAAEAEVTARLAAADADVAAHLAAAGEKATNVVHDAGQRAQAMVNEAMGQAEASRAEAEALAAAVVAQAALDGREAAEAERDALAGEIQAMEQRAAQLLAHTVSLEAHVDRLEAHVDHLELYLGSQRRRLATTAVHLARILRDPDALAGVTEAEAQPAHVPAAPVVELHRADLEVDLDEVDIAGELFGLVDPTPVAALLEESDRQERPRWEDDELVGSFFGEGPYADDRWLGRKDRRG